MARVYAGKTAEARSSERRRRFLDAGVKVIGERGLADATVRGVCEAAGLSTRFFYESFDDLEQLALAVYHECVASAADSLFPAIASAGATQREKADTAMRLLVGYLDEEPERARIVFIESLGIGALSASRRQTTRLLTAFVMSIAQDVYPLSEVDPGLQVAATLVAGGVAELLASLLDGSLDLPRAEVIRHGADLLVAIGEAVSALAAGGAGAAATARPATRRRG